MNTNQDYEQNIRLQEETEDEVMEGIIEALKDGRDEIESCMLEFDDVEIYGMASINTMTSLFRVSHEVLVGVKEKEKSEGNYKAIDRIGAKIKSGELHMISSSFWLYDGDKVIFSCDTLEDAISTAMNAEELNMHLRIVLKKFYAMPATPVNN